MRRRLRCPLPVPPGGARGPRPGSACARGRAGTPAQPREYAHHDIRERIRVPRILPVVALAPHAGQVRAEIQGQSPGADRAQAQSGPRDRQETEPGHQRDRELLRRAVHDQSLALPEARLVGANAPAVHEAQTEELQRHPKTAGQVLSRQTRTADTGTVLPHLRHLWKGMSSHSSTRARSRRSPRSPLRSPSGCRLPSSACRSPRSRGTWPSSRGVSPSVGRLM